jgi:flagellar motor switch protein FliM
MSGDEDKTLSQKEIDALLAILPADGGPLPGDIPGRPPAMPAKLYDFRSPNKFSKEQMRTLKMIHESFARRITSSLSAHLRTSAQATFVYIEQGMYKQLSNHVPEPSIIYIVKLAPLPGRLLLSFDAGLAAVFVDRLLGGSGHPVTVSHQVTDIEVRLVKNVATHALDALRDAWSNVVELEPHIEESALNTQFVQVALTSDAAVFIALEIKMSEATGTMTMAIPYPVIKPIVYKLSPHTWVAGQERTEDEQSSGDMRHNLWDVPVDVVAQLGEADLTIAELMSLRPGDVIPLNSHIGSELPLLTEDYELFRCRPGTIGSQMAVLVTKSSRPAARNNDFGNGKEPTPEAAVD